jgi:hypothetical protein
MNDFLYVSKTAEEGSTNRVSLIQLEGCRSILLLAFSNKIVRSTQRESASLGHLRTQDIPWLKSDQRFEITRDTEDVSSFIPDRRFIISFARLMGQVLPQNLPTSRISTNIACSQLNTGPTAKFSQPKRALYRQPLRYSKYQHKNFVDQLFSQNIFR